MPTLGQTLDPSQYTVVGQLDPVTMKPIQQPVLNQQSQQQKATGNFNIDRYAAESAANQMNWARSKGAMVTMDDFEGARKQAYQDAAQFQREQALEQQRNKDELQRQMTMKQYEQVMPQRMTSADLDKVSGLLTAPDTIMNLYNLHKDATNVPGYGTAVVGGGLKPLYDATDQRVRLYGSMREGSKVALARGVMEDTGAVAGKESSQELMDHMLPNEGDNAQMGAIKTAGLLQLVLDKQAARIRSLRADNIMTDPLQDSYKRTYTQYQNLVQQYGTQAQQEHPAASPDELFGGGQAQKTADIQGPASLVIPTKAGVSDATKGQLLSGTTGLSTGPTGTDPNQLYQPVQTLAQGGAQPTLPTGTDPNQLYQTPRAIKQQQATQTAQALPSAVLQGVQGAVGSMATQPVQSVQQTAGGVQSAINWLGGLLPENWNQSSFQQQ